MIRRRVETTKEWRALHPNVFVHTASPSSWEQLQFAACLWSGGVSAVRSAGFLYDLPGCECPSIEVVTTRRRKMPRCGIVIHHTSRLPREHVTKRRGIPVTSIERTLLDLCGYLSRRRGAIAMDDALRRGLTTLGSLDHCLYLTARRGRNGSGRLRELVHERVGLDSRPESPLETVIWELLLSSGLPLPTPQFVIRDSGGDFIARPDFVYPMQKIVIEGHSKKWHWGAQAHSEDARRHNKISRLGYRIVYVTWSDATVSPDSTLRVIADLLFSAS